MTSRDAVAGYFRISRARDDMKAPELYRSEIESYCAYKGLELAEVFSDIDASGRKGAPPRAGLDALVASRDAYGAVVIPKLSRFGRSMTHLMQLFDLFEKDGIALVFLDLGIDMSTSQGRLLRNVMAAFAEYESDVRSDYSRASHDRRARLGLPDGNWAPYGYVRNKDTYDLASPQADVVRDVFVRYAGGESMAGIARALNAREVPSARGLSWTKPAIRVMLENPHYAALRRCHGELVTAVWPAIVDADTWTTVHGRLAGNANRGVIAAAGLYLLSGLIECGVCGRTLHHRTRQDRVPGQYVCRGERGAGYCAGGGIAEHRAERLVVDAYLDRHGALLVYDPMVAVAPMTAAQLWAHSSFERRRAILKTAIARVVLVARPPDNRRGTGLARGRDLTVSWATVPEPRSPTWLSDDPGPKSSSRVCEVCGRRKHVSNFAKEQPNKRKAICSRCRGSAPPASVTSQRQRPKTSWSQWRRRRILFPTQAFTGK